VAVLAEEAAVQWEAAVANNYSTNLFNKNNSDFFGKESYSKNNNEFYKKLLANGLKEYGKENEKTVQDTNTPSPDSYAAQLRGLPGSSNRYGSETPGGNYTADGQVAIRKPYIGPYDDDINPNVAGGVKAGGQIIGSLVGGYFGGPMGAAAGGKAGGQAGGLIGNYAGKGK